MPINKNAISRYRIIDELLSNRHKQYSITDIMNEVNRRMGDVTTVGKRTIEKDINFLEYGDEFFVEIERYSIDWTDSAGRLCKKRCLRYADPAFSIYKKEMSDDEKHILREALSMLGQFDGLPNLDSLENLRKSLQVASINKKIISFTKNPIGGSNLLGQLFSAISNEQVIEIDYRKFDGTNPFFIIHPHMLKEYNRRWFLLATLNDSDKIYNFALDRIHSFSVKTEYSYKQTDVDFDRYFDDIIGVTNYIDRDAEKIIFWVGENSINYVKTKPFHESQIHYRNDRDTAYRLKYPQLKGGGFFSIECKQNYELERELTYYAGDLVVLEPESIRSALKNRVKSMIDIYNLTN